MRESFSKDFSDLFFSQVFVLHQQSILCWRPVFLVKAALLYSHAITVGTPIRAGIDETV